MLVATRFLLICASTLALPAICCLTLGLPAAISQTVCEAPSDPTAQEAATCGDVLFIGVHGSSEGPDSANNLDKSKVIVETCKAFEKQALESGRQIDVELLDYTAPNWDGWDDIITASGLKDNGRSALDVNIQISLTTCPVREIVLAGYTFGAWIIDDWLSRPENSADLPRIRAVQLYGDPLWRLANPGTNPSRRPSIYQGLARRFGQAVSSDPYTSNPIGPPGLTDRWESYCLWDDAVCGQGYADGLIMPAIQLARAKECADPNTLCIHEKYAPGTDPVTGERIPGVTEAGGQFLAGKAFPLEGTPEIVQVDTFRERDLVFFSLLYTDPSNEVAGFGFRGAKGAGWAEEIHTFGDRNPYVRVSPGRIEYPFNHLCETGPAYESDVEAWLQNSAGNQITPTVTVHLSCSAPIFVILGPAHQPGGGAM